jgi:hypothetical protein
MARGSGADAEVGVARSGLRTVNAPSGIGSDVSLDDVRADRTIALTSNAIDGITTQVQSSHDSADLVFERQQALVDQIAPALYRLLDEHQDADLSEPTFEYDGERWKVRAWTKWDLRDELIVVGPPEANNETFFFSVQTFADHRPEVDTERRDPRRFNPRQASPDLVSAFAQAVPDLVASVKEQAASRVTQAEASLQGLQELADTLR